MAIIRSIRGAGMPKAFAVQLKPEVDKSTSMNPKPSSSRRPLEEVEVRHDDEGELLTFAGDKVLDMRRMKF